VHRVGTQKHFKANPASPIFQELCGIAMKTVGLAEPLRRLKQGAAFATWVASQPKLWVIGSEDVFAA